MRNIATRSFIAAIGVAVILVIVAIFVTWKLETTPPPSTALPLLNFELDIFKAILAGFVVGMLGILIPAVASEARQRFEQRKESRIAYSQAKTSIDYLKLRLATANLSEATSAVQQAHFNKHIAELYDDFPAWLEMRYEKKENMTPMNWDVMMYARLFAARRTLEDHAATWDDLSPSSRISLLDLALPTVPEIDAHHLPRRQ